MDHVAHRDRRGPQVYFHVEFGVSWSRQGYRREVTPRSRRVRERSSAFPRHVPARNTNYLAAKYDFHSRQRQDPAYLDASQAYHVQHRSPPPTLPPAPLRVQDLSQGDDPDTRQSRSSSASSHERGRSTPPPIGDNPWDVNVSSPRRRPAGPQGTSTDPAVAELWKPLPSKPSDPSQFRLGEESMPWSAWSWPFGYDPAAEPLADDDSDALTAHGVPSALRAGMLEGPKASHPGEISTFSPGTSTDVDTSGQRLAAGQAGEDPGRTQELESLSAAMMTVDNGFENQWWNQGKRASLVGTLGEVPEQHRAAATAAAARTEAMTPEALFLEHTLGWAMVSPTLGHERHSLPASAHLVSPMSPTELTVSDPSPSSSARLHRIMSTRSEELFYISPVEGHESGSTS